jgi:hypothetical protein
MVLERSRSSLTGHDSCDLSDARHDVSHAGVLLVRELFQDVDDLLRRIVVFGVVYQVVF